MKRQDALDAMRETNIAQRAYYEATNAADDSAANGWATNLWRWARRRAVESVSENARWQVYERQKDWAGDLRDAKVLDLGVAMGSPLTEWLSGEAREMHLLDLSEMQISVLRSWLGDAPNRHYHVGDVLSEDWASGDFNLIYAHSVLHHFQHLDPILERLNALLAPGGRVITYDPLNTFGPVRLLRRAYRPFQTDSAWEHPFDGAALKAIEAAFEVEDRLGVFGRGKWAWAMGLVAPPLARRYGDALFLKDLSADAARPVDRALHVTYHLRKTA